RASALECGDHIEPITVAKPHVDDGVCRRGLLNLQQAIGNRLRRRNREAALLQRFGKTLQEGMIILDDQNGSLTGVFFFRRRIGGLTCRYIHGHHPSADLTRILARRRINRTARNSDSGGWSQVAANANDRSKSLRLQLSLMTAPRSGCGLLLNNSVAPER